eukprot:SAG31_NODE_671_length_12940_cov_4.703606_8_plen_323_part_00
MNGSIGEQKRASASIRHASADKQSCFINTKLTLKSVNVVSQEFTIVGYVNALWQCPDLEVEDDHQDYYSPGHVGPTIKQGLAVMLNQSNFLCCLDRPYVQKEIRWALKYKKKIITVYEKDERRPGHFDYYKAAKKYSGTEWEFLLGIDAITYQRDAFQADGMMKNIFAKTGMKPGVRSLPEEALNNPPLNEPGCWNFFVSHHQARGGDQAQAMYMRFKEAGFSTWYDNEMLDKSEAAMEEGVRFSTYFILILTGDGSKNEELNEEWKKGYIHTSTGGRKYIDNNIHYILIYTATICGVFALVQTCLYYPQSTEPTAPCLQHT